MLIQISLNKLQIFQKFRRNIMNKLKNIKNKLKLLVNKTNKDSVIPIFFATDDNYIPFLEVALRSLIENASVEYKYKVHVLNTGLKEENKQSILSLQNSNFSIEFNDISACIEPIKMQLKNVYHFSLVMYYRLFIEKLFPRYDKALYLDCDIVVLGDISKLYFTNLNGNLVGAIKEQVINSNETFKKYAKFGVGVEPEKYFNSGILVMNLKKFRELNICARFMYLIDTYNFDVVDPDQAYLNVLCKDKVKYIPNGWNKEALPLKLEGKLNIVHYALYKKPWQYDDVINGEYFWNYAQKCNMYNKILDAKQNFTIDKRKQKEQANIDITLHAVKIINSNKNMYKTLFAGSDLFQKILDKINFDCLDIFEKIRV